MRRGFEREDLFNQDGQGRREACETLVHDYYKAIYGFMVYLTNNTTLAEDLTQETFISAYESIDSYQGRASIKTWLFRIAYHKFVDSRRRIQRESGMIKKLKEGSDNLKVGQSPLRKAMADEDSLILMGAVRELEWRDNLVIVLHYIQDLSFRQMSEILNKPVGTVKWQTSRALKRLKRSLNGKA